MFAITKRNKRRSVSTIRNLAFTGIFTVTLVLGGSAQTTDQNMAKAATAPKASPATVAKPSLGVLPILKEYKELIIGSTADEVRAKLGKAKIDDKDGFYYQFGDGEFAQIRIDKNNKVRLISITYSSDSKNVPGYTDVFGADATIAAKADGSVYKLVRYPQAGYWVAYSRTAGNDPSVTVTMQKLQSVK